MFRSVSYKTISTKGSPGGPYSKEKIEVPQLLAKRTYPLLGRDGIIDLETEADCGDIIVGKTLVSPDQTMKVDKSIIVNDFPEKKRCDKVTLIPNSEPSLDVAQVNIKI